MIQSDIVKQQLALHKPSPPGPPKDRNLPLLTCLAILLVGLVMVFSCVWDSSKTSVIIKCLGPGCVMAGITSTLIRILFSYKPACCGRKLEQSAEEKDLLDLNRNIKKQKRLNCVDDVFHEERSDISTNLQKYKIFKIKKRKPEENRENEIVIKVSNLD